MFNRQKLLMASVLSLVLSACGQSAQTPTTGVTAQRALPTPCMEALYPTDDCPTPTDPGPTEPTNSATLSAGAIVLDSAVVSYDYSTGTLVLNQTPVTATYAVGNAVIGGIVQPGAEAGVPPRRITGISVDAMGRYVMTTSEAGLTDIMSDATLNYSRTLSQSDIAYIEGSEDQPMSFTSQQKIIRALGNPTCDTPGLSIFSLGYEKTFENNSTIAGCFDTSVDLNLQMRISHWSVQYFEASVKLTEQAKLLLKADIASGEIKVKKSLPIATVWFSPIDIQIGPVPFVITPYIKLTAGVEGSIAGTLSYTATQVATYRGGIKYENGSFAAINDRGADVKADPLSLPSVKATVKASVDAKPGIAFFTTIIAAHADGGVYAIIRAYAKLDVDPMRRPLWQVTAGPQFCAGFDVHVEVLLGLYDQSWTQEKCGAEIRLLEKHSADLGPTIPGTMNNWNKVELKFALSQGEIEVYRRDSGVNTFITRMDSAKTFDLTPYIINPSFGDEFVVVGISKRTSGIFGSYSHQMGMRILADGMEIWHPNDASCSYCGSREEYDFEVIPSNAILNVIQAP